MSVKEKAKAFEDRQSIVGESPPPKKKSREELVGNLAHDGDISVKPAAPPIPPPRKYKKNGTLIRQPGDSSPLTERKENVPEIIPAKPASNTSPSAQQRDAARQKKPRPPPPQRGSSLVRKNTMPANLLSVSGGKKPRPPVPPKPKNYVPKKLSSPGGVNVKSEVQSSSNQTAKERADSAPMIPTSASSDERGSQFFFNLEKGNYTNAVPSKQPEPENSSQFFVPLGKQTSSHKSTRTEDTARERQITGHFVSASTNDDSKAVNSIENGKADTCDEMHENGVSNSLPHTTTIFYDHVILSEDLNSGKESPDPLEGLEIEVDALSDDQDEEFSKPFYNKEGEKEHVSYSSDVNGATMADNLDIVVTEQSCGELKPGDDASDSKENVKVMFSLVLEEECSVSMIDDTTEGQRLVDVTVINETTDFSQSEEEMPADGNGEFVGETKKHTDHEVGDETVELAASEEGEDVSENSVVEPLSAVDQDVEKFPDVDINKPAEDTQPCDVVVVSENLTEDTQGNIVKDEVSIKQLGGPTVEQNGDVEPDLELESQGNEQQNQEKESNEVIIDASVELTRGKPQENREIIMAEPIREGTFISVSDHVITQGTAELREEKDHQLCADEEATFVVKDKTERRASLSENTVFTQSDVGTATEENSVEIEDDDKNIVELQCHLAEASSQEVECKEVDIEMNKEEKCDQVSVDVSDKKHVSQTDNIDFIANTEALNTVESDKPESISVAEVTLETSKDVHVVECTVDSTGGLQDNGIAAAHVETFDSIEETQMKGNENENEAQSPSSPEPVPPERPSRKARQGKHAYENINIANQVGNLQTEEKRNDSIPRRTHSFSRYETVVFSLPRPIQRVSDDEAIYRVPSKVIPVHSYTDDESLYSVPCAIPTHHVLNESEYSVPKPIVVQACAVTDRRKADEDGAIYAVPGLPTAVPAETFAEVSNNVDVHAVPQENDNIYVVPGQRNIVTMVTATVASVPPPKPPRLSLSLEQDKKEKPDVEKANVVSESPKPVPRTRGVSGDATPELKEKRASPSPVPRKGSKTDASESTSQEVKEQRASPSPVPRRGSKTEASEPTTDKDKEQKASPSPAPRKGSQTAQTTDSSETVTTQGRGSPAPIPRVRLNALHSNREAAPSPPITLSSSEVSTDKVTEDEATPRQKAPPPPRPPPPAVRNSIASGDGTLPPPLSPGLGTDLESDSDSDVGEEEASKGPPKPKTYHIAHEILSTERTFVDALKLVFEECYGTIKTANVVADSVLGDIFRDLENIYLLDSRFLQELEERMVTWDEHERIGDIIKKYGHFLKMYTQYVNGYDKAMSVFQDTMKENSEFANLVSQFQASERCHGMILSAYMLKPVQRIPSYRLLLMDYLKHLPKDSEESEDTEAALKIVSEVATHINESMKKLDSFEQMLKLQNMLVGHPEIVKAGRDYLKEGMLMKLCRKDMQERMFFLLTDVLLYTTPMGANQYKLNKMLPLLGMQVTVPDSPDFVNEFSIISTTRSFTLTASTPEERDNWVEALNNAMDVVTKRKITFVSKTRDATGLLEQDADTGIRLGEKAPVWIPDARVTMCMSCTSPFTLTNRRHHCRACGNVVCGSCSESTAPLAYLDYTQARVCDKCYDLLLKEFHTEEIRVDEEEPTALPPLLDEAENAEKLLRKPTKFEMMRRFKSKKTKRKSQIIRPGHLTEVVANQEGIQMSGYLRFKKGRHASKKSWFVLKGNVLYSYKASSDVVALETMPVLSYEIEDQGKEGDDFAFQLKHKGVPPIMFKADNETSAKRWVQELTKATKM